jgi:hypothetical protein
MLTTDAYRLFAKMLKNGNPPDAWYTLLVQAKDKASQLHAVAASLENQKIDS